MFKYTCVFLLGAAALCAQPEVATTGMVGLGDAQTAQLNLLNPACLRQRWG